MWQALLGGASMLAGLLQKGPDANKAYQKMKQQNPEMQAQITGADQALLSSQNWYQTLLSGDPNARRALFAGTMYDMDRAAQGAMGQLTRNTNVQRGGALTLGISNLQRDLFANKAKAVTGKEEMAAQGLQSVAQGRSQLLSVLGNMWQGAGQMDLQAKQFNWNKMFQTGLGIGGLIAGGGGKGISGLFGKGGGATTMGATPDMTRVLWSQEQLNKTFRPGFPS